MRYASFWKRFNAYGYDVLIVQVAALGLVLAFTRLPTLEDFVTLNQAANDWASGFTNLSLVLSAAYNIYFVAGSWQATPGKRYCRIIVVNRDGSRLTFTQSAIRHAASGLSTLAFGLGFLPAAFNAERITLHDMICGTRVVLRNPT
ncbi:MAG: RDD family protein [Rickettsiales bacterium]